MKWRSNPPVKEKMRKAFLWFPRSVYDAKTRTYETRWLETAKWREERRERSVDGGKYWETVRWLDR